MTQIQRLDSQAPDFRSRLHALLAFETAQDPQVDDAVQAILPDLKQRRDAAVLEYTCRFCKSTPTSLTHL